MILGSHTAVATDTGGARNNRRGYWSNRYWSQE